MGGRGAKGLDERNKDNGGGGGAINEHSLISERETHPQEVDDVLRVASDMQEEYGWEAMDYNVGDMGGGTIAYAAGDSITFNTKYFDAENINKAYDECVDSGFHPSRGSKSAIEAVAAHEMGHALTYNAAFNANELGGMDKMASRIVKEARMITRDKNTVRLGNRISRYASTNDAETIAEAVADVYCNGNNAKYQSKAVVRVLNKYAKMK